MIEDLFPDDVVLVVSDGDLPADELYPVEAQAVARAVEKRRRDFALGRACARAALERLGVARVAIPSAANRAPEWPPGVVGAITHCDGLAAAAVARTSRYAGIGLDAEPAAALEPKLARLICTARERDRHARLHPPDGTEWTKLVFSAKESVHKAVAPASGITLGFQDVELEFDVASASFRAVLVGEPQDALPAFDRLSGRFALYQGYVVTSVTLAREPSVEP